MSFTIAPIVEGHGDVSALPVLLRRMWPAARISRPVRFPRSRLLLDEHLRRAAAIAAANLSGPGAILLVVDGDEDCAAVLGPKLERLLATHLPQCVCRAVLPVREFEAWIVGGDSAYGVTDPDNAGDLKGRIQTRYGVYRETVDQPRLIALSDLDLLAKCSRSFRRLRKVVDEFEQLSS